MLTGISRIKIIIENREYLFLCENDSPFNHVKEALVQSLNCISKLEEKIKAQQEQEKQQQEENKQEEIS